MTSSADTSASDRRATPTAPAPFSDLAAYTALPRVGGLTLSPDGTRLVTTVAIPNEEGTGYASSLWEVDPAGEHPAHRLTRGLEGEAGAAFAADGTLYFTSTRQAPGGEEKTSSLWALPARGGEARAVLTRPGGVSGIHCASAADTVVLTAPRLSGARTEAQHAALAKARKDAGVDAILHTGYPVRFWDHDLGPAKPELFVLADGPDPDASTPAPDGVSSSASTLDGDAGALPGEPEHHLRHLTGFARSHAFDLGVQAASDGSFVLVGASRAGARADLRDWIARVDTATGEVTVLADEDGVDLSPGPISHDGTRAIITRTPHTTPDAAPDPKLHVMDTATGALTPLAHDWDLWPHVVAGSRTTPRSSPWPTRTAAPRSSAWTSPAARSPR